HPLLFPPFDFHALENYSETMFLSFVHDFGCYGSTTALPRIVSAAQRPRSGLSMVFIWIQQSCYVRTVFNPYFKRCLAGANPLRSAPWFRPHSGSAWLGFQSGCTLSRAPLAVFTL